MSGLWRGHRVSFSVPVLSTKNVDFNGQFNKNNWNCSNISLNHLDLHCYSAPKWEPGLKVLSFLRSKLPFNNKTIPLISVRRWYVNWRKQDITKKFYFDLHSHKVIVCVSRRLCRATVFSQAAVEHECPGGKVQPRLWDDSCSMFTCAALNPSLPGSKKELFLKAVSLFCF